MIELEKSYGKQTEGKNSFVGRYLQPKCFRIWGEFSHAFRVKPDINTVIEMQYKNETFIFKKWNIVEKNEHKFPLINPARCCRRNA